MNRRTFLTASLVVIPAIGISGPARACDVAIPMATPAADAPIDSAQRVFRWPDDDGPRSVSVRIARYTLPDAAEAAQDVFMADAVPEELPQGEYYGSDLQVVDVPGVPDDWDVRMHAWHTTVGVAAFTTAYAAFTARHASMLWSGTVVTSRPDTAVGVAGDLIALTHREPPPCARLDSRLPTIDDLPEGARLDDVP